MSNKAEDTARNFSYYWNGRGGEESNYQDFWRDLLHDVFGVERTTGFIEFQQRIDDTQLRIDGIIERTKVLIEHKSFGVDLDKKILQSDGEYLTPFEQAKRYAEALPYSTRPRRVVTCNFDEFRVYDLIEMNSLEYLVAPETYKPKVIKLAELPYAYPLLEFLVNPNAKLNPEVKISTKAAQIVQNICRAIDKDYAKRDDAYIDTLSKFCARLVFCFYADDEKLFTQIKFDDWFQKLPTDNLREELQKFFYALNTADDERSENLDDDLKKFPCVNGGLFDEKLDLPPLNEGFQFAVNRAHYQNNLQLDELRRLVKFSWREISPPIFGAMFESLFNVDTRRTGGIHYTSPENIHKVIDPLFLDDLSEELADIKRKHKTNRVVELRNFQDKLAALNFLDPACGSGNFLTETYLSLRALENKILDALQSLNVELPAEPVKVSIEQFYGIEINDFAVAVAQVAMWIAENQMLQETEGELGKDLDAFPLKHYPKIICANALRVDWQKVFDDAPETFDYIIGNPPYVGARMKSDAQSRDIGKVFDGWKNLGNLDYVTCWYKKAADLIRNTETRCAFISTNSIVQGETGRVLWEFLFDKNIHIDFARRTFKWLSDSDKMAHVYCVVVGFSKADNPKPKVIFDGDNVITATNINAYLVDAPNVFIKNRNKPPKGFPKMTKGSQPTDGGHLIIEADEINIFLRNEPAAAKFVRPYVGAEEFIDGKKRYCLWLVDVPAEVWRKLPHVVERVEACAKFRLTSATDSVRRDANKPTLFTQIRQPTTNYLLVPRHSSENRSYVPIGFMSLKVIASDATLVVPDVTLYHFGVLTSSTHMAWMRTFCGRLESRYRYSPAIYNNFPWPSPTSSQRRLIEQSAQMILDARAKFSDCTFAKLYDEETMPDELRSAHSWNDFNVARAYGFDKFLHDEARVVAELMKLYAALTNG